MLIQLKGDIKIDKTSAMAEKFRKVMRPNLDLQLDLAEVTALDSNGMQMLLSVEKELNSTGGSLSVIRASAAVEKMLKFYNIDLLKEK